PLRPRPFPPRPHPRRLRPAKTAHRGPHAADGVRPVRPGADAATVVPRHPPRHAPEDGGDVADGRPEAGLPRRAAGGKTVRRGTAARPAGPGPGTATGAAAARRAGRGYRFSLERRVLRTARPAQPRLAGHHSARLPRYEHGQPSRPSRSLSARRPHRLPGVARGGDSSGGAKGHLRPRRRRLHTRSPAGRGMTPRVQHPHDRPATPVGRTSTMNRYPVPLAGLLVGLCLGAASAREPSIKELADAVKKRIDGEYTDLEKLYKHLHSHP